MINELQRLSDTLEKHGVQIPISHPWIKGVKKGEALLVNITDNGIVDSLEFCTPERVKSFWNIEESNKTTFPKINSDALWGGISDKNVLRSIVDAGSKKDERRWISEVKILIESNPQISPRDSSKKNTLWKKDKWTRLYKFPNEKVLPNLSNGNEELLKLIHCFDSFKVFSDEDIEQLFLQISKRLLEDLEAGKLDCFKIAELLFVGKPDAKAQNPVTLIFNHSNYKTLVANEAESIALVRSLSGNGKDKKSYTCPLTGRKASTAVDKFPNPNLPLLGNTTLMSMFKDARCHYRYGKIGAEIFGASLESTAHLDNVLRYITSDDLKHKTWIPVASGKWEGNPKKELRDLLICAAEHIPQTSNEGVAFMLGGDSDYSALQFEAVSSKICDALEKHISSKTNSIIRVFIIRKISKGQSQVVLNDFCSVSDLFHAVELWNLAVDNHPLYSLYLPLKKGEKAIKTTSWVPFPADLPRLLQYQWIREGKGSAKLDGCSLLTAYDLFFERGERTRSTAMRILQLILQRMKPLLIGIGKAGSASDFEITNDYSVVAKRSALQAVAFLGIILFKLGYKKENYMKDVGYNIGRLLSFADCLHKEYCKLERHKKNKDSKPDKKAQIPNQLLGNSTLQVALDNPVRGLARLSERIAVYKAWADRSKGEDYKLALWAKNQMGLVSEQLSEVVIPSETDDLLKAQILLGYLAHSESNNDTKEKGEKHENN